MEAGAWPFLVGGMICLVKSDNERDLILLNSTASKGVSGCGLRPASGGSRSIAVGILLLRETLDNLNQWKIKAKTGL